MRGGGKVIMKKVKGNSLYCKRADELLFELANSALLEFPMIESRKSEQRAICCCELVRYYKYHW